VHEDDHADADAAPSSLRVSSASPASTGDSDDTPDGCKMVVVAVQMEPALHRLPHL
jgi:hypothetical protein